jgi:hypothetical protein
VWTDAIYLRRSIIQDGARLRPAIQAAAALGFPDVATALTHGGESTGTLASDEARHAIASIREGAQRDSGLGWAWGLIARAPGGRRLLRGLRRVVDREYWRMVDQAFPEYYFHRD